MYCDESDFSHHDMRLPAKPSSFDSNPVLLRSFVAVAECAGFTAAAARLGIGQSTVSQHVRRLEETVGTRLLARDTHSVLLTEDGNAMLGFAREVLAANERIAGFFSGSAQRTRLRIGISEDFAIARLSGVLGDFRREEPLVDIELAVGLSGHLYQRFDAGELDVIFAKRKPGDQRGRTAWRSPLVWIAKPGFRWSPDHPLPLVVYQPPSITRSLAMQTLDSGQIPWRIACSSGSLSGLTAALTAGLGAAAHAERLVPAGLAIVSDGVGLPSLPHVEFVALGPGKTDRVANRMVAALTKANWR
jgi:DNA-binding transcriptional LysR family regulator